MQAPGGKPTVLLVDDDADVRGAMTEVLHDAGYEVEMAANGREALRVLSYLDATPCLILLDLVMPVTDGYGFLEQLQRQRGPSAPPVVVVTASDLTELPPGARELLNKPLTARALLELVARYCPPP